MKLWLLFFLCSIYSIYGRIQMAEMRKILSETSMAAIPRNLQCCIFLFVVRTPSRRTRREGGCGLPDRLHKQAAGEIDRR